MSGFLKIFIVSFIIFIIGLVPFLFIFSDIFYIREIDFINLNIENKYKKELSDITEKIENYLSNIENNEINIILEKIDFTKFLNKQKARELNLAEELSNTRNFIVNSDYQLEKIKLLDNSRKIIFSTSEEEAEGRGSYIFFRSSDAIEYNDELYKFKDSKLSFLFLKKTGQIIVKKNIIESNQPIGIILFYYKNTFLNDILRRSQFVDFQQVYFVDNNIIIIEKPKFVDVDKLINYDISGNEIREVVYRDSSGNEISKAYRLFYKELKNANAYICRFIDNDLFKLKKSHQVILFYFLLFSIYLLILLILLLKRSQFDKAKEKMSLFVAAILEEMIQVKSKDELEKIHKHLQLKKENVLKHIFFDFKKLNEDDKKKLEGEIDTIFNRIDESMKQRGLDTTDSATLSKIESLFEKFVSTIAEKGINISSPVNISPAKKPKKTKGESVETAPISEKAEEIMEALEVEELDSVEEIEELGELEEAEMIEEQKTDEIIPSEEIIKPEEILEIEEIGETEEVEEVEELAETEEPLTEEISEPEEILEIEELGEEEEELNELKESEDTLTDDIEKAEEALGIEEIGETEEAEEAEELAETEEALTEEISEPEVALEIEELGEEEKAEEPKEKDEDLTEKIGEYEEALELEELSDAKEAEQIEELKKEIILSSEIKDLKEIEKLTKQDDINKIEEILEKEKKKPKTKKDEKIEETLENENLEELKEAENIEALDQSADIENIHDDKKKKKNKKEEKVYPVDELFDKKIKKEKTENVDELLNEEILNTEIPTDISIENYIEMPEEAVADKVPKIPDDYYNEDNLKSDELAGSIKELLIEKTPIQMVIEEINNELKPFKITLLMNIQDKYNFIQIHQVGFKHAKIEKISLDENDLLTRHLFTNKRMIFVADINKVRNAFINEKFEKELYNIKSLMIYPVKIFSKIRSLLLIFFEKDESDNLEKIIDTLESKKDELKKSVIKLI
ncbi:MAG: cache domain-containing protein [Spirochaetes bacterium]|nr:cache domain-containing protein [Spirochaetota bacterium]